MYQADRQVPISAELKLILACGRVPASGQDQSDIRNLLASEPDWTAFVRTAVGHGIAGLVGHRLAGAAPDMVPDDILDALSMNLEQTRRANRALFLELADLVQVLANRRIRAIPLLGPVLALHAYGDLGFRTLSRLRLLIGAADLASAVTHLCDLGYRRRRLLTAAQLDFIRYLQGYEALFKGRPAVEVCLGARLTPIGAAVDIDYAEVWRRARDAAWNGRTMPTLAPADALFALMVSDDPERPWGLGRICDAAHIGAQPELDWMALIERARRQGCRRMVLLMAELARLAFRATIPDEVANLAGSDPAIATMIGQIVTRWQENEAAGAATNAPALGNRLWLHDGIARRAGYLARRVFLPRPYLVARIPLPARLTGLFTYTLIKIAHDLVLLPLVRAYRFVRVQSERLRYTLAYHGLPLGVIPFAAEQRRELLRHQAARARAKRALAADPNDAGGWQDLGDALCAFRRYQEAVACYDKVLDVVPDSPTLWRKRSVAIAACRNPALLEADEERRPDPEDANGWVRRAGFLSAAQRFAQAAAASDRALAIDPDKLAAIRIGIKSRVACCDWRRRTDDERRAAEGLRVGVAVMTPFNHRAISNSEADNLRAAQIWAKSVAQPCTPLWRGETYGHDRIRLAYLSGEYHDHPTARHIVGVFENHDRTRFETIAVALSSGGAGEMRDRIERACDRFLDVHALADAEAAAMLRQMEIDIAIDMNGHAGAGRAGILARRPAAVQVGYLGNAGTTGAPFIDYIIADPVIIPTGSSRYYTEKVIRLPYSYQCNDARRHRPEGRLSRADVGLPEAGFVFCCFNNNYKISPAIFDVWMRLLNAVPDSVLWLLGDEPYTIRNLRREARTRGVAPERLLFTSLVPVDDHLARQQLADLFLDTLPMNAHATASDALWAGLPVLTCTGNTFGGRVAASLLYAVGLPELVAASLGEYERLALALARDPELLAAIRAKLVRNRDTEPLFDTLGFTNDLERAYMTLWNRQRQGLSPASFKVERTSRHGA